MLRGEDPIYFSGVTRYDRASDDEERSDSGDAARGILTVRTSPPIHEKEAP